MTQAKSRSTRPKTRRSTRSPRKSPGKSQVFDGFHPCTQNWFRDAFAEPTRVQTQAWPSLCRGENALLLAATGSGKTLAAFLAAIDRIMFDPADDSADAQAGVRVLYISPLKALGVDVDRNLRSPVAGITQVAAREGVAFRPPRIAIRSGDTESRERQQIARNPPDILISTPESLFLLLTSKAREILTGVRTVIIDEIHTMVATKRGAHLFMSLERLEQLRDKNAAPLQRIGLSATQHPVDEAARLLGGLGATDSASNHLEPRPVAIIDARETRNFELKVEMPLEEQMERAASSAFANVRDSQDGEFEDGDSAEFDDALLQGNATTTPSTPSIWSAIYPRIIELIRAHRSTMIFVNSRRLAERLAQALNEESSEELAQAHHGSLARETRTQVEDRLKRGELPAIVATSSLELGLDIGAVDLVIQIESPPSISSGLQRIGRSGHQVDGRSAGIVFPKYRGDLLATAAASRGMLEGAVESSRYLRNPLDVLAQQIVAMIAIEDWSVEGLYRTVRSAAPFAELPRASFDGVLDLLAGRYPSDEFAGLIPRVTWDRLGGHLAARKGAQRTAILNAGTIPDRGLFGVFLFRESGSSSKRVGELDEEMVFELNVGEVFRLGVSTWRVLEINRDQVIVEPAPGEPGKMPFWRGDGLGRPYELGLRIGELTRTLGESSKSKAVAQLVSEHALDAEAAQILVDYVRDQNQISGHLPTDRSIVIESFIDELGDWRVIILTPFGTRVHAPWAMAVTAQLRTEVVDLDIVWTDDGIVFRFPKAKRLPT